MKSTPSGFRSIWAGEPGQRYDRPRRGPTTRVRLCRDGELTDADKAIAALNGTLLDERTLNVNEARPKKEGGFRDQNSRSRGARRW
jgi:hypothetical protein